MSMEPSDASWKGRREVQRANNQAAAAYARGAAAEHVNYAVSSLRMGYTSALTHQAISDITGTYQHAVSAARGNEHLGQILMEQVYTHAQVAGLITRKYGTRP
jgi:hypothetical protein